MSDDAVGLLMVWWFEDGWARADNGCLYAIATRDLLIERGLIDATPRHGMTDEGRKTIWMAPSVARSSSAPHEEKP